MKKRIIAMLLAFVFVLQVGCFTVFAEETGGITSSVTYDAEGNQDGKITFSGKGFSAGEHSVRAYYLDEGKTDLIDSIEGNIDNLDQIAGDNVEWEYPSRIDWLYDSSVTVLVDNKPFKADLDVPDVEWGKGSLVISEKRVTLNIKNYGKAKDGAGRIVVKSNGSEVWSSPIVNYNFNNEQVVSSKNWAGTVTLSIDFDDEAIDDILLYNSDGIDDDGEPVVVGDKFSVDAKILGIDNNGVVTQADQGIWYEISGYDKARDGNLVLAVFANDVEIPGTRLVVNKDLKDVTVSLARLNKWAPGVIELRVLNVDDGTYAICARATVIAPELPALTTLVVSPSSINAKIGGTGNITAVTVPTLAQQPNIDYTWTSENTAIVTVSPKAGTNTATYRAYSAGTTSIAVKANNLEKSVTVKVAP